MEPTIPDPYLLQCQLNLGSGTKLNTKMGGKYVCVSSLWQNVMHAVLSGSKSDLTWCLRCFST